MKAAIMQPYLFPYIGYFQLINAVDFFVVYDDVNFIKKGWINRNNILVNNTKYQFVFPVKHQSQNAIINTLYLEKEVKNNFLKTVQLAYSKAPFFNDCYPILSEIFYYNQNNLAEFIFNSLKKICNYIGIKTEFLISSEIEKDNKLKGQQKIIEICKNLNVSKYINPIGGIELYDINIFSDNAIKLNFIKTKHIVYKQFDNVFVPWLSIIDILMFNSKAEINKMLNDYELI